MDPTADPLPEPPPDPGENAPPHNAWCGDSECGDAAHDDPRQYESAAHGRTCQTCGDRIEWLDSPGGSWWAHEHHPADGHDAVPAPRTGSTPSNHFRGWFTDECAECGGAWPCPDAPSLGRPT